MSNINTLNFNHLLGFNQLVTVGEITDGPTLSKNMSILSSKIGREVIEGMGKLSNRVSEVAAPMTIERRIDHFAYFDSRQQIEMFASWARQNGFMIEQMTAPNAEVAQHMLVFHHDCRPLPEEISSHTSSVAANANRLGGEYAGWTTTAQARAN